MAKVKLSSFAWARSGDKGDGSNVGIFVKTKADYELIKKALTVDAVKRHFHGICKGEVTRYEAFAEIVMSRGPKGSDANAFDARQVSQNLAASIQRPVL